MKKNTFITPKANYIEIDKFNLNQFYIFCMERKWLLLITGLVLISTYFIKIFFYNIGIDMENYMCDGGRESSWIWSHKLGRYGYVILQQLMNWYNAYNPIMANWVCVLFIYIATLLWCDLFYIFSHKKVSNFNLTITSCIFITSPIWAEAFYFTHQAVETSLILLLSPIIIYLLFKSFVQKQYILLLEALLLLTFCISIYQSAVPFVCCGVLACIILYIFNYDSCNYKNIFFISIKIFIGIVVSVLLYFAIYKIFMISYSLEQTDYLTGQLSDGNSEFITILLAKGAEIYNMTVGKISILQSITNPIIMKHAEGGVKTVEFMNRNSIYGSVMLIPLFFMLLYINKSIKNKIQSRLFISASIGIFISIFFFAILADGSVAIRTYWALPLALSFLYLFILSTPNRKIKKIITVCALVHCIYQLRLTSQLFMSDYLCFRQTEEVARCIWNGISELENSNKPLIVIGQWKYKYEKRAMLSGDILGHSPFQHSNESLPGNATKRVCNFMQTMGFSVTGEKDEKKLIEAEIQSKDMPSYPQKGYIKEELNYIIVKLSDSSYKIE